MLFCYGNSIYNPSKVIIPPYLLAHEAVHANQQGEITPGIWWQRYIEEKAFRLSQELEAHRVEYEAIILPDARIPRQQRRRAIHTISERLAGPLYGNLITKAQAKKLILEGLNDGTSD